MKRFSVRKIKVGSYSRQGWLMSERESFAVYDRLWKKMSRGYFEDIDALKDKYMYVRWTEFNNRKFVAAIADYLNETVGDDLSKNIDGFNAWNHVLKRDLGHSGPGDYAEWCEKFGK